MGGFLAGHAFNFKTQKNSLAGANNVTLAANLYSFDLLGTAFGAFITSIILIPFSGYIFPGLLMGFAMLMVTFYAKEK